MNRLLSQPLSSTVPAVGSSLFEEDFGCRFWIISQTSESHKRWKTHGNEEIRNPAPPLKQSRILKFVTLLPKPLFRV